MHLLVFPDSISYINNVNHAQVTHVQGWSLHAAGSDMASQWAVNSAFFTMLRGRLAYSWQQVYILATRVRASWEAFYNKA